MPNDRMFLYECVLLVALVSALTVGAWWIYPTWDDGRLLYWSSRLGEANIYYNYGDRPLLAYLYIFLFRHQIFQPVALASHFISWLAMGLITMRFWRLIFPAHAQFALLPALLSVAPVVAKCQLATFTIVFPVMVGPLLIFVAVFLIFSGATSVIRRFLLRGVALVFIAFAVLITNYAVTTAAVAFVVITAAAFKSSLQRKRELLAMGGLTALVTLSSYATFCWITRSTATPEYRPGYALTSMSWKIEVVPFRWLAALWRSTIGGVLESLGAVTLNTKITLLSFICGLAFAGLVALVVGKNSIVSAKSRDNLFSFVTLLIASALALLPVFLMGRTLEVRWDTRFILPILPVLSSLMVFILLIVIRKRLWILVPVLCGFLAAYWTTYEILNAVRHPEPVVLLPRQDGTGADRFGVDAAIGRS